MFGVGGPGGAALGSGIGSLARGDEADQALKNAALGYAGGKGVQYIGGTPGGSNFLGSIPGGDFIQGGMDKDIFGSTISKGKELLGMGDPADAAIKAAQENAILKQKILDSGLSEADQAFALERLSKDQAEGSSTEESLFNLRNLLGLTAFSGIFGNVLDQDDKGEDTSKYVVTTDTPLKGFDSPTQIKKVSEFAANGGLMSLAKGGFPRKNGKIEGPGTETSDDIPAMLSDGEFVVNARTVRGIGESMGGSGKMNARERGAEFLYGVQDKFGGRA